MNFNQLKYIIAVDKHRNFARAAEACDVAQSTLSKEIQRLERQYEIMIFDRTRHPVVPTMKGQDLIRQAEHVIKEQAVFEEMAFQKQNSPTGEFRLGILSVLAPYLLPLFVRGMSRKYRKLNLKTEELSFSRLLEKLSSGKLDGAICLAPFPKEGFYERRIFQEEFFLYMPQNHPLRDLHKITLADLREEEMILQEDLKTAFCSTPVTRVTSYCSGEASSFRFSGSSLETIRKMVDLSEGVTLIPGLARLYMGERRLKMVKQLEEGAFYRTVSLVMPRGFEKNRISKVLVQEIKAHLPVSETPVSSKTLL